MRAKLLIGVVLVVLGAVLGVASAQGGSPFGSYIVVYKAGVDADAKTTGLERALSVAPDFQYHAALKGFAAKLNDQQLSRIQSDPDVAYVSADQTVEATGTLQPGETAPTGTRRIAATTSSTAQGSAAVNVAVIDTGIDLNYGSELNAVNGTNCVTSGNLAQDDNGHGTHVSGTIAAKNSGAGVVGVAPGTKLYAVKVLNSSGSGTWSQVICGIDWVTANASALNIKVASMSLGGSGSNDNNCGSSNNDALHAAICNSKNAGVTYVVAAGNSGANFSSFVPAAYPEVVTVTAVSDTDGQPGGTGGSQTCGTSGSDDAYAYFSNYASSTDSAAKAHTVAAPGVCILSTWLGGGENTISGTSMATPHVSGAVALCISSSHCTAGGSPSSIISALQTTDASKGFSGDPNNSPVSGRYYGYIIWLGASAPTAPDAPTLNSATPGDRQVTLQWSAPPSNGGAAINGYTIYRSTSSGTETQLTTVGNQTSWTDTGLTNGTTYWYQVAATNSAGTGSKSTERSATPQAPPAAAPSAPQSLTAQGGNGRGIQLSWQAPASNGGSAITGYRIYRSTDGGFTPSDPTLLTTATGTSLKDMSGGGGTTYYYYVTAVNSAGESPRSNEANAASRK